MEKKETVEAHPLGMCEKLYNAFTNSPTLLPFRRPHLTTGSSATVTDEGRIQSGHAQLQAPGGAPLAKVGLSTGQQKAVVATNAAANVPKSLMTQQEGLAEKVADPVSRRIMLEPPQNQPKNSSTVSSAARATSWEVTAPEKEKVAGKVVAPVTQQRLAPPVVPSVATEKGSIATMAVPTIAAEKGKAAPPVVPPRTMPNMKAAAPIAPPTAMANGKAAIPSVTAVASEKGKTEPPIMQSVVTEKDMAATALAAAPTMEKGKAALPVWSITNINERSEDFIKRAKNSMRSLSTLGGAQK